MTQKPTSNEDEYFSREDALRKHKLALEHNAKLEAEEQERRKQLHFMKCPKCGYDLETVVFHGLNIEKCFHCHGTWLDAGELEQLAGKEQDFLHRVVAVFKK